MVHRQGLVPPPYGGRQAPEVRARFAEGSRREAEGARDQDTMQPSMKIKVRQASMDGKNQALLSLFSALCRG